MIRLFSPTRYTSQKTALPIRFGPITVLAVANRNQQAKATGHWFRNGLTTIVAFSVYCGLSHRGLTQVPETSSAKLFGLSVAKEDALKAEILSATFPRGLLAIGIGSPASHLAENFPNPGDKSGDPASPYHIAQNLIEKEGEETRWPYFGHRMSVFCRMLPNSKPVVDEISVSGLFETKSEQPFRKGGRTEIKALISALCSAYGKPAAFRVVDEKKVHIGQVDFDQLVWKRPEGTVFLMISGSPNSGSIPFLLDIRDPEKSLERMQSIRPPRWNEKPEAVGPDFSKRFESFCDLLKFDVKK